MAARLPGGPTSEETEVLPLDPRPLVLVIDDELTPRSRLTSLVRALGFQARSCPSGATALRFLQAHPGIVRLVLADLAMPRMDGGELAERCEGSVPGGSHHPHGELRWRRPCGRPARGLHQPAVLQKPVALGPVAELLLDLLGPPTTQTRSRWGAWRRAGGAPTSTGCSDAAIWTEPLVTTSQSCGTTGTSKRRSSDRYRTDGTRLALNPAHLPSAQPHRP